MTYQLNTHNKKYPCSKLQTQQQNRSPHFRMPNLHPIKLIKTESSVAEKYQIKLVKDMGIKCTFDHSVIFCNRLHSYPLRI